MYADVRKGGGGGVILMQTKADRGGGQFLRTSFMDDCCDGLTEIGLTTSRSVQSWTTLNKDKEMNDFSGC